MFLRVVPYFDEPVGRVKIQTKIPTAVFNSAWFRRGTSHEPNRMLMRENKGFFSFTFDSAHVKYVVLTGPKFINERVTYPEEVRLCLTKYWIIFFFFFFFPEK